MGMIAFKNMIKGRREAEDFIHDYVSSAPKVLMSICCDWLDGNGSCKDCLLNQ